MSVVDDAEAFARFLQTLPEPTAAIVAALDSVIRRADPTVVQVLWAHQRVVGYGVGVRKMSEHYCYIAIYGQRVNLGFNHGVHLEDPSSVLQGTGRSFRFLPMPSPDAAAVDSVRVLLQKARRERVRALGE